MAKEFFSGHIYIFHSFDVGDDIKTELVKKEKLVTRRTTTPPKYFKGYQTPLEVELPHPHATSYCESVKLYQFGVFTLRYKIPFTSTLEKLRNEIEKIENEYREQSVEDAAELFKQIKKAIKQPNFFHTNESYLLVQVDPNPKISSKQLKEKFGGLIASTLRFETEILDEYKKNEILERALGYYREDLFIIDINAAFIYSDEFEELLDLFDFTNVQHLELQYFNKTLNEQLDKVYHQGIKPRLFWDYLPLVRSRRAKEMSQLSKLKVEISVITERLENSIKIVDEPYFSEIYKKLSEALDLKSWKTSIQKKLNIIHDISSIHEDEIRGLREDIFNILIVILIFLEFLVAIMHYYKM